MECGAAGVRLAYLKGTMDVTWGQLATTVYQILETVHIPDECMEDVEKFCNETKSNFLDWAEKEVKAAGLLDADSDYDGMLGEAVLELVNVFDAQGHSGMSAAMVKEIFDSLASWKPLSPLTNNPEEWMEVTEGLWQSRRNPACFSEDGGKTYTDQNDPCWLYEDADGCVFFRRPENEEDITVHKSEPYEKQMVEFIMESYRRIETDESVRLTNDVELNPVATLADEWGGRAQIGMDDGCYVLYLQEDSGKYKAMHHIFPEAFDVLKDLPSLHESEPYEEKADA
jgi:hypothetical protein